MASVSSSSRDLAHGPGQVAVVRRPPPFVLGDHRALRQRDVQLPQSLVQHHAHRVRQVEAPHVARHRDPVALLRVLLQDPRRQPVGLVPEDQHAVRLERRVPVVLGRVRREVQAAVAADRVPEREPVLVHPEIGLVPVVEAGALHVLLVQREAERADQVQRRVGGGAEARDVPGVGRDARFDEGDVQGHGVGEKGCREAVNVHPPLVCISRRGSARRPSTWYSTPGPGRPVAPRRRGRCAPATGPG